MKKISKFLKGCLEEIGRNILKEYGYSDDK